MTQKEASVKLTLNNSQFIVTIKDTGDEVDKAAQKGKKSLDLMTSGIGGAKRALGDLGGTVKSTLGMVATFGGAFSAGRAIQETIKLRSSYQQLAYQIEDATGRATSWSEVQQIAERASANTGRSTREMTDALGGLIQATGDVDFSRKVLDSVGTAAMGTGKSLDTIGTLADQLHTKFGVAADGMLDTLAAINQLSSKGGPSFEEFADVSSAVGAELLAAGLEGKRGLNFMLGALIETDDKMKSLPKQVTGLRAVLRGLSDADDLKKIADKLHIDPKKLINEKDAIARLRRILAEGQKGINALVGAMGPGEEKQAMQILFTDPFEKALADANASGLKGKAALDAALATFDSRIGDFGKSTANAQTLIDRAAKARQTPEARLNEALDNLQKKFGDPRIIGAIDELAKALPELAEVFGDLVSFAAQNPILAGTLGIGGKAASGFLGEIAGEIIKGHVLGGGKAGAAAGDAIAKKGLELTGALGETMELPVKKAFTAGALAAAPIIAAAAATAYAIGKEQIDNAYKKESDVQSELTAATAASYSGGSMEEQQEQLQRLKAAAKRASTGEVGRGFIDNISRGVLRTGAALGINDAPIDTRALNQQQLGEAGTAIARKESVIRQMQQQASLRAAMAAAAGPSLPAAVGGGPPVVKLDDNAGRVIGVAVATALGGTTLSTRVANAGEIGLGRAQAGPGGSRGPMLVPKTMPGGGV